MSVSCTPHVSSSSVKIGRRLFVTICRGHAISMMHACSDSNEQSQGFTVSPIWGMARLKADLWHSHAVSFASARGPSSPDMPACLECSMLMGSFRSSALNAQVSTTWQVGGLSALVLTGCWCWSKEACLGSICVDDLHSLP